MKAREFWVAPKLYSPVDPVEAEYFVAYDQPGDPKRLEIHVIEYSAYQALEARHKKLLEALEKIKDYDTNDCFCDHTANEAIEADEKAERG